MKTEKLTLAGLIARKDEILEKQKKKTAEIFVKSLNGSVTIESAERRLVLEAQEMTGAEADDFIVFNCVVEPRLKEEQLQKEFGCVAPREIVEKLFTAGEIAQIAAQVMKLSGYEAGAVKLVEDIKN